jgi:hypothetical protein
MFGVPCNRWHRDRGQPTSWGELRGFGSEVQRRRPGRTKGHVPLETPRSRVALHKFARRGHCGTNEPARSLKYRKSIKDRGPLLSGDPHEEETVLRHFRISQRRRLRDTLVAGTIAAAAACALPHLAWAHSHARQIGAYRTTSKEVSEKGEDRDRHRSLRAKLFASSHRKPADSPQSHATETASGESESLGVASIYSDRQTASGEIMDAGKMTAAHRALPFGTHVTVVRPSRPC